MASHPEQGAIARRHISSRTIRRLREGHRPTLNFPDRFKDLGDDADEDVLPPSQGSNLFMNMNQSIFGLIAAAGSNVDFNDRFEGQSSDDEDVGEHDDDRQGKAKGKGKQHEQVAKNNTPRKSASSKEQRTTDKEDSREIPGKVLQSSTRLPRITARLLSKDSRSKSDQRSDSSVKANRETSTSTNTESSVPTIESAIADRAERVAPVMSRMLEAKAETSSRPSFELEGLPKDQQDEGTGTGHGALARKLKEIFEFDEPEEVVEGRLLPFFWPGTLLIIMPEYPCWLLQSVLLQGYLYITSRHLCFYAYLPRKAVSNRSDPLAIDSRLC